MAQGVLVRHTAPCSRQGSQRLHDWISAVPPPLLYAFAGMLGLLLLGSAAALILPRLDGKWVDIGPRARTWWIICAVFVAALLGGWLPFVVLMAGVSAAALNEFIAMAPTRREDRPVIWLLHAGNLASYAAIALDNYAYFLVIAPIYIFVCAAALMAVIGRTDGFLAVVGILHWGVIICVFFLGHVAFLMRTPFNEAPEAGPAGLVVFLFITTEINDVAQYFWGRAIGRHKVAPRVSPNKTWEGAIGGWATTTVIFVLLAPYFTPLRGWPVLLVGGVLPILGFLGDITMSAIKRDLGVKDASKLLPGHGGILDRIDSLTFTAPWYFHMLAIFALDRF